MILRLIVEHHSPALYDNLRSQLKACSSRIAGLEAQIAQLQMRYGAEIQYNAALCDLLREHGISYREVFSHASRYGKTP